MAGALIDFHPSCVGGPLGWSTSYWMMLANHALLLLLGLGLGIPYGIARGRRRA